VDQVHRGVEMVVDERMLWGTGRVFADLEGDGPVGIHMISAVLRVVLENKDSRVVPVSAVRDRFHHPTDCEIVIGNARGWSRLSRCGAVSVIVGQIKKNECRKLGSVTFLASANESVKLVQEFISPQLIGILRVKVGK